MKISAFDSIPYYSTSEIPAEWPVPPRYSESEPVAHAYDELMERLQLMEDVGFDWISWSEHHYAKTHLTPSTMIPAAFAAAKLEKLGMALMGPTMPLNNPIRVAEELAMLDNLIKGRMVVGLLRGTQNEPQTYGVNPLETREISDEAMALILKAWTEPEPFSWAGRHYDYRVVSAWPRPYQRPMPLTYALGTSVEALEFAARNHLGCGVSFGTLETSTRAVNYYRERCAFYGWEPTPEHVWFRCFIAIGETDQEAIDNVEEWSRLGGHFGMRPSVSQAVAAIDRRVQADRSINIGAGGSQRGRTFLGANYPMNFIGSPDSIIEQAKECVEVMNPGTLDFWFLDSSRTNQKTYMRSLKLFGEEVIPAMKEL